MALGQKEARMKVLAVWIKPKANSQEPFLLLTSVKNATLRDTFFQFYFCRLP